jgi:biopolymer transport protein ExbD
MGGSSNIGEASDNPVEINVTAMVDVIFCLCIFFMCSFHFKQLEGKIDAWMPKDGRGNQLGTPQTKVLLEEIRVFMRWDPATGATTRKIGSRAPASGDADLMDVVRSLKGDYERAGKTEVPVIIDATPDVPWTDVIHVLDLCKAEKLAQIEFAEPMEFNVRSQSHWTEERAMNIIDRWFGNSPWWLISAGLHAVVLLGAALVVIERIVEVDIITCYASVREPVESKMSEVPTVRDLPEDQREFPVDIDPKEILNQPFVYNPDPVLVEEPVNRIPYGQNMNAYSIFWGEAPGLKGHGHDGPGVTDSIGMGRGSGFAQRIGRFDGQGDPGSGGPPNRRRPVTDDAVLAALRWLARHQSADGSWSAQGFSRNCGSGKCSGPGESDYDAGVTGLSLLAFLGAGFTPMSKDSPIMVDPAFPDRQLHFGDAVKHGLQWLITQQDVEGCVGERGMKHLYSHAIGTLALSEGYGMTGLELLRGPAQKSVDYLVAAQNPGKGWRYSAKCGDNDTSVTGWAVMALKSAELSGLTFSKSAFDGALAWLREATENNGYYRVGYNQAGTGKVFVPSRNEQFSDHPSMSAVAVLSRIFIQKSQKEPALTAVHFLAGDLPEWKTGQVDFYYWYYASLALFQVDGPKGAFWSKWNEPMKAAIVPHQKLAKHGCENGSWDPSEDRWGFEGGRVYAAAINCLTLEVYYRYAHVFGTQH